MNSIRAIRNDSTRSSIVLAIVPWAIMATNAPRSVHAQCADWLTQPAMHHTATVYAMKSWDPDGAGPAKPLLVVMGYFDRGVGADGPSGTGGVPAKNIAALDTSTNTWQALGSGLSGESAVGVFLHALEVYKGELIAGGAFNNAGGTAVNKIARWDGVSWKALGAGVSSPAGASPHVSAMSVYNNELIVGGEFVTAGSITANNIARWDGSTWKPLVQGLTGTLNPVVRALAVYNNELIAAGQFSSAWPQGVTNIARWNGTSWNALSEGVLNGIYSLTIHGNKLITGDQLGGAHVHAWDGTSWAWVGVGLSKDAFSVASFGGDLFASGFITSANSGGATPVNFITRYDGTSWKPVGSAGGSGNGLDAWTGVMAVHEGKLYAGGYFRAANHSVGGGGISVESLARWNGTSWEDVPGVVSEPTGTVLATTDWKGRAVIAGDFSTAGFTPSPIGNSAPTVVKLAAWDGGTKFEPLGGTGNNAPNGTVRALHVNGALLVGGDFTTMNGTTVNRIASVNDVAPFVTPMGPGFANGEVFAIHRFGGPTDIFAGGSFTLSGTTAVNRIAKFTGSSWIPVGTGMNGSVRALRNLGASKLYAGGSFTTAGGVTTNGLAIWNGTSWAVVGGGFPTGTVNALAVYDGKMTIGGQFVGVNGSLNIMQHNGGTLPVSYSGLGTGANAPVHALGVSVNDLVVGGDFTSAGGVTAQHIARYTAQTGTWSEIDLGASDSVRAVLAYKNEIHIGGSFDSVLFNEIHAPRWARYTVDAVPWFAKEPASTSVSCGADAAFEAQIAAGYGGTLQWRKDGQPLSPGGGGGCGGSTIVINGSSLIIQGVTEADAGTYNCVASNACGSAISAPATLTVNGTCPFTPCYADCDCSGQLGIDDFICFQTLFALGDPYADCDASGDLGIDDFICFQTFFAIGC